MQIPLMSCERAWAYAMQLKFELNTEPRKKYHMINRCDEKNGCYWNVLLTCREAKKLFMTY